MGWNAFYGVVLTREQMEQGRLAAAADLGRGLKQADVAQKYGVSEASVSRWAKALRLGGLDALPMRKARGAEPRLDAARRERLAEILEAGPRAAGGSTDLWTGRRIAEVVRREFGVGYNRRYVPSLLRSLGFTGRKPRRRAREKDEDAKRTWLRMTWRRVRKTDRGGHAPLPGRVGLRPHARRPEDGVPRRRAGRPRAPLRRLAEAERDRRRGRAPAEGSPRGPRVLPPPPGHGGRNGHVAGFLRQVGRHVPGRVIAVLDNSGQHRGPALRAFLDGHPRFEIVRLPPYCPELNPDEDVWAWVKRDLANLCALDDEDLVRHVRRSLRRMQRREGLAEWCLRESELPWGKLPIQYDGG